MHIFNNILKTILFTLVINLTSCKAQYPDLEDGMYAEFITTKGVMVAKLTYDKTPVTVANFVSLAEGENPMADEKFKKKKFYNGLIFHRVIDGFMIQGGDPTGTGSGNAGYKFMDEFSPDLKHDKPGILSMANSGPNTNGTQFFITEVPKPNLDNRHSVFGELVIGLDIQDSISNVKTDENDRPIEDVIIEELNIIRKGKTAKKFDAPTIFMDSLAAAERREKENAEKAAAILKATQEKFKNLKEKAITLHSGLKYIVTEKGHGEKIPETAEVLTHYTLYFEDGKILDTSKLETAETFGIVNENRKAQNGYQPITAEIGPDARMIPGFKEGLQQLSVGDKATLFIPYHLAYGESGTRGIPGKSNIIFEVEILELLD
ncbi:peptidylprolyl isomerase [Algibacter pacificus]|uniref:peptidylprolyl isomerase n=1 Tax=Algibacter pacificus TaxID=2599389 RepID=UPI0011C892A8|nr:peptidylprolyl isomerase [Algibacter pacificus]